MEDDAKATSCSIKTSSVAPPSFKRQCFICLLYRTTDYKKKTSVRLICCYRKRDALASLFFVDDLLSEEVEEEKEGCVTCWDVPGIAERVVVLVPHGAVGIDPAQRGIVRIADPAVAFHLAQSRIVAVADGAVGFHFAQIAVVGVANHAVRLDSRQHGIVAVADDAIALHLSDERVVGVADGLRAAYSGKAEDKSQQEDNLFHG